MEADYKSQLAIKQVTEKDVNQFNELLRYVFQITDDEIEESGFETKRELLKSKQPILKLSDVFGWFQGDQLVSQIAIYPCEVNIHGKIFAMGGITGVGTYPEFAGHGLMKDLIHLALTKMRAKKQWISYLYPYSIPYYRNKGWEIMSDKITFKLRDTQLPKAITLPGIVERKNVDDPDVDDVYQRFAKENHGALIRNQFHWEEYWRYEKEEERTAAIYYDENHQPQGVLFYWIRDDIFHVREMFYLNQEARNGLWNFISAHFSMVYWVEGDIYKNEPLAFLIEDSQFKETIEPYYMARIVDVEEFLAHFPFNYAPGLQAFHLAVTDPLAEWNQDIFGLEWDDTGKLTITRGKACGEKVALNIQTLSCLLMNYRRATYLAKIERLQTDAGTLKTLELIIPDTEAYFSDYF